MAVSRTVAAMLVTGEVPRVAEVLCMNGTGEECLGKHRLVIVGEGGATERVEREPNVGELAADPALLDTKLGQGETPLRQESEQYEPLRVLAGDGDRELHVTAVHTNRWLLPVGGVLPTGVCRDMVLNVKILLGLDT